MNSPDRIEYRNLNEDDFEAVFRILRYDYTYREPVSVNLKISVDCPQLISYRSYKITQALKHHVSVGAFEKSSGELVGCAIAYFPTDLTDEYKDIVDWNAAPLNYRQMLKLLSRCHKGVTDLMGDNKFMEVEYMVCRHDYAGFGIGKTLFKRALENARQTSCKKIFVVGFSYYVQRIAEQNDFQYYHQLPYAEYLDPLTNTKIFDSIPQPHVKAATLTKTF